MQAVWRVILTDCLSRCSLRPLPCFNHLAVFGRAVGQLLDGSVSVWHQLGITIARPIFSRTVPPSLFYVSEIPARKMIPPRPVRRDSSAVSWS